MQAILILIIVGLIYLVYKKQEFGIISTLFIVGFGDLIDFFLPGLVKLCAISTIFLIEALHGIKRRYIRQTLMLFSIVVLIKESLGFLVVPEITATFFITAIYVYIMILFISYVSLKELRRKKVDFWNQYTVYIVLGLIVQLIRTFYDYQFFGIKPFKIDDPNIDSYYQFGEAVFRPSSLMTPIVFSIELGTFIGAVIIYKGVNLKTMPLLIWSIIGLMLTNSRSGMMVLFIIGAYWIIKNKKVVAGSILSAIVVGALYFFNYSERLQSIYDFKSRSYNTRFTSINTTLSKVSDFSLDKIIFGAGYGAANYPDANGDILYYVEDFYITLLVNSGYFALILFILYLCYVIKKGIVMKNPATVLLICIIIVNFVACSLMIYTVQLLFWTITLSIIWDYQDREKIKTVRLCKETNP